MKYYADIEEKLKAAAYLLKATPDNLSDKISHMLAENKSLHSEIESLKSKMAQDAAGDVMDQVKEVKGVKLLAAQIDGVDMNGLRDLGDQLKEKLGDGVVVLASGNDGKVSLMATATDGAMKKGRTCGQPGERHRRMCRRWRRRTPEHGAGRRQESGRNPGCPGKSGRSAGRPDQLIGELAVSPLHFGYDRENDRKALRSMSFSCFHALFHVFYKFF